MDEGTPNPNKPRLSRRLLSHFTLTLSVLLALSFVTLAVVGPTENAVGLSWDQIAVVASSASAGAAAGAIVGDGIGAVLGAAGGAVIGALLLSMNEDKGDIALSSGAKSAYASGLKNVTNNYYGLVNAEIDNLNALWNTSQYYLVRKAEYAALALYDFQIENSLATTYDSYYVLSRSEVANATASYTWAMCQQLESVINSHSNLAASFVGTYDGMSWGIMSTTEYDMFGRVQSSGSAKSSRLVDYLMFARTDAGQYVTIPANSTIYLVNTDTASQTQTVSIKNRNGTTVISESVTLSGGQYKTYNLATLGFLSGDYTLSEITNSAITNDHLRWFGDFSKPISNAGTIYPAILTFYKSGENANFDGAFVRTSAWNYRVMIPETNKDWDGGSSSPSIYFDTDTTVQLTDTGSYRISLESGLSKIATIIDRTDDMQTTANSFAQTYYNYLVANGPDAPRIMPDIIFPDPSQLEGMSWQQIYAIFLAYMTQIDDWFESHNAPFDMSSLNITAESLLLLCRGAIFNSTGAMIYNNQTIWTPYISLEDMMLYCGQNNTLTQPGFIIIWGSAAQLAGFDRPTTAVYVPTSEGYDLYIEEMTYNGTQVTEQALTVTSLNFVIYGIDGGITPPQGLSDLDWLLSRWYYFAIVAGIICLLAAISLRNVAIIAVGLILLAAGGIGYWMAGDFSLLDAFGLSMEPSNLKMWLQQLR